jgi:hypothetical protein
LNPFFSKKEKKRLLPHSGNTKDDTKDGVALEEGALPQGSNKDDNNISNNNNNNMRK